jgi:autotransporter-associated beta strand protein
MLRTWWRRLIRRTFGSVRAPLARCRPGPRARPALTELEPRVVPAGLTPAQISHIYGFDQIKLSGGVPADGRGQTIAIIDVGNYIDPFTAQPYVFEDLSAFDHSPGYNLPDPPHFIILDENGGTNYPNPANNPSGAYGETALDVEWVHALAPQANILLYETYSLSNADLFAAVNAATHYNGSLGPVTVVSMSFGGAENLNIESTYDGVFTTPSGHAGITFVAAAGDDGAGYQLRYNNGLGGVEPPEYPSISPNVLAVGGTTLTFPSGDTTDYPGVATSTSGVGEKGWGAGDLSYTRFNSPGGGSGGGISSFEPMPSYQFNYGLRYNNGSYYTRAAPDVAFDASTSVSIVDSLDGLTSTGGTSFGAPAWAALIGLADEARAAAGLGSLDGFSQTLPDLYALPGLDFHDITVGNDGYAAGPGYDLVTGLGSPVASRVVGDLWGQPAPTANADSYSVTENTTLTVSAANGVLANDTDPLGETLSAPFYNGPAHGTITFIDDGSFVYTPNSNFTGTDTFSYTLADTGTGYTRTGTVTIQVVAPLPDLTPYQPSGWDGPLVVTLFQGATTNSSSILTTDTAYVDWAVANFGQGPVPVTFQTQVLLDGVVVGTWTTSPPLNPNTYTYVIGAQLPALTAGTHTLKLVTDSAGQVSESNENNNTITYTFTVHALTLGSWNTLAQLVPGNDSAENALLLSDGSIMVHGGGDSASAAWYRLTPDATGSYVNGTWSNLASMNTARLFAPSVVLRDGRVFVMGGEYTLVNGVTKNTIVNSGEIYDAVSNTWTPVPPVPASLDPANAFGDDPLEVLPDGTVLAGYIFGPQTFVFNPTTGAWSATVGAKLARSGKTDRSDEETWVKLPDGSILTYDIYSSIATGTPHAERYVPSTGLWVDAGSPPALLSTDAIGDELGGAVLLPDGRVLFLGGNGKTAFYTPSSNTWVAGPAVPNGLGACDAAVTLLPDGNVLLAASPLVSVNGDGSENFPGPTTLFEFNPTTGTYTDVTPSSAAFDLGPGSFLDTMLMLPTGQVLLINCTGQIDVYTSNGAPLAAAKPVITGITPYGSGFTLSGTQLNGISEGASYGDDNEMASNYPIVRLQTAGGTVSFARTSSWSSTGVATGSTPVTTQFAAPAPGAYLLSVSANGVSSGSVLFVALGAGANNVTLRLDPNNTSNIQVLQNGGTLLGEFALSAFTAIDVAGAGALTLDYSNGTFGKPVNDNGSGTSNALTIADSGALASLTYDATGSAAGDFVVNGDSANPVTFTSVQTATDTAPAGTLTLNVDPHAGIAGLIHTTLTAATGLNTTATLDNGLVSLTFADPTSALVVNGHAGNDAVTVTSLGSGFNTPLTVNGGGGTDTVSLNSALRLGTGSLTGRVTVTASTINLGANLDTTGGTSPGVVTLNGTVTLTAGVSIKYGGTSGLSVSGGVNLGANSLTLTDVAAGNTGGITGAISGSGGLTKAGPGTLTLGGASTYSGPTTVAAGTLRLGAANALPSGSDVTDGGTLDLHGFSDSIGALSGSGTVTSAAAGAVTLTVGADGASGTFVGVLQNGSGTLALTKSGTGTEVLSGSSTYTGTTTVAAGTLEVDGSITAAVTVSSGGTLDGGGGTGAVTANGVLAPGLLSTGAVTFGSGSSFTVVLGGSTPGSGSGHYTQDKVTTGTVTIGTNVTLNVSAAGGYVPTVGTQYVLISNGGGQAVSGSFAGLAEGAQVSANFLGSGLPAFISYAGGAGNDVVIVVRQAPAFTSPSSAIFAAGQAGSFTVTASGSPTPTLSESPGDNLPSGVTFTASTGVLAGTPATGTGGTYTLHFTAHNGVGSDATQTFTLTVGESASITSASSTTFTVGAPGSFTVTAIGFPTPTLSESPSDTLPGGVSFNPSSGVLSGTPASGTGGQYTLHFTAHNGAGADGTQTFTLTVNQATAFTSPSSGLFAVGQAGSFTVTASGFPAPTLSESGTDNPPSGVSFDPSSGVLSGTPAAGTGGQYTLHFTGHNGVGADATQTLTLTVGQAAAITSADNTTFTAGSSSTFTVMATGFPTPTLSESSSDTLPGGVSFNANTGVLSGTPAAGSGGQYTLHFTAHNGAGADATQTFTLTVNQAPAFTSPASATFAVGQAGSFTVTASGFPAPAFSESNTDALPGGVTFDPSTGILSGTPTGSPGTYALHFTASNAVSSTSQTFTLTVGQAAAFTSGNSTTFTTGSAGSFAVTASGFPTPTLSEAGSDTLPAGVTFNPSTGVLGGTPAATSGGTYTLHFTAHNGAGSDATQTFTLTVNQPAVITSAAACTFTVGLSGSFMVTATGFPTPALSESNTDMLPGGVTFDPATGVLIGTPAAGSGGTYTLHFTAHNGVGSDASQTFSLTVDQAPAFTSAAGTTFTTGSSGSFMVTTTGFPAATLSESNTDTLPGGVSFNASTGVLSGTPAAGTGGVYTLHFTAHNGLGPDATQTFTLTVNQPLAITSAGSTTFTAGAAGTFTVTANGFPTATLSESSSDTLPGGVTFNASTGALSGTPAATSGGVYTLHFTAHNGVSNDATQTFTLTVNQAATFTSAASTTFATGAAGSFTVVATGFPAATLSENPGDSLPGGVTFDPSTGLLSGTPAAGSGGAYTLHFTAHNGVGADASQTFTLTVDQAAAITSAASTTLTVGVAGSFTVTASGFPTATLSESAGDTLPGGLTFNRTTGVLSGTPAAGSGGVYTLHFTAHNSVGPDATQTFTLTVNQAAAFTSNGSTTFTVGTPGSFTVTASGFPAPGLSESTSDTLPGGITFDPATGVLSGTPVPGSGGVYTLHFTAHNGIGSDATQTFTLTVNQPAAITSTGSTTFTVGTMGTFRVTAAGFPVPILSESPADMLPPGVSFDPDTGLLSGTPVSGSGGTYTLHFTAHNGVGGDATQTFTLTVDQAPAITSAASATFTTGSADGFTLTATGFPAPVFSESPGDTLPSGVTFNPATGVLSGTPAAGSGGVYVLHFTAHNGVGSDATQTFTLTVNQPAAITSAASTTFTVGATGTFTLTVTGFPVPTLSESGSDTLPGGVSFNPATGILSGTPVAGSGATYTLHFTAHNGVGADATQTFTLTVDQAPAITSAASATFTTGSAGSITVTATGFPAPTLSESSSDTLPSGVSFNPSTGVLGGTPAAGTGGVYTLHFTAHNGVGSDATQTFTLTVNQPAAFTSAAGTAFTTGAPASFTVTASGFPAPSLSENAGDSLPSGITFNPTTGVLGGTAVSGSGGVYTLHFTAQNGVGADATQTFTLTVNQAPAITSGNSTTFTTGSAGTFTVMATGFPAPTLSESSSDALPSGVSFNAAAGVLSGTPAAATGGIYTLHFTAHNGAGTDATQTFTLTVNQAPAMTSPGSTTFTAGAAGSFPVTATGFPAPTLSENPGDTLPSGVTFDPSTGTLSGTSVPGSGGVYTLHFTAHNGIGSDASQTFSLTVDQSSAITSGNSTTFTTGITGTFTVMATGFPVPTLSQSSGDTLPSGVSFNAATGVLSGKPVSGSGGQYTLHFTAHNGIGGDATQTFTLTVNQPPAFTNPASTTFTTGSAGSFTLAAGGFPAPTFSESGGDTLPTGVSFDPGTGVLSGTPTTGSGGTYTLHFTADNGVAATATQTFTLTVDQAPAITSAASTTITTGAAGSFTVMATGFPAPGLSESPTDVLPSGVFFNPASGILSGTPVPGSGGQYTLHFTAHNGIGGDAAQTFALIVDQPPAITSGNNDTFTVESAGSFTVTASGFPAPVFSENGSDTLPSGVTFNAAAGVLSGTPAAGTGGTYTLHFTAHNGIGGDATQTFTLTVDQAPAISSTATTTFTTRTAGSFTITTTGFPAPGLSENPGDILPGGVTFNASTGVLSGTPVSGSGGTYTLHFTAANGIGSNATKTFTLTVDQAPAITSGNATTFTTGTAGGFTVTATGFPAPSFSESSSDTLPSGVTFNAATGVLSGTPVSGSGGVYTLHFTAANGIGSDATQTFTLTVDQAPAITSAPTATFTTGTADSTTVTATGFPAPVLSESPADTLPAGVTFNPATGILGGTPAAGTGGTYTLHFRAHNGVGSDATQTFNLTINQSAAITSGNATTFTTGTAGSFTVTTSGFPKPSLTETGALPTGVGFTDNGDGTATFSGTPAAGAGNPYTITLTAPNGIGGDVTQTFTLTVDQAAAITSAGSLTLTTGSGGSLTMTAIGFPAPALSLTGPLPDGITFTDNHNGTATLGGTPAVGTGKDYPLLITAHNGIGADATQPFTLTVDQAPAITSAASTTFTTGTAGTFTLIATGFPAPVLSESTSDALPGGVTFDPATGTLSGTPAGGSGGTYKLRFTAHNGIGADATQTFTLTVNQAPALTSGGAVTFTVGQAGVFPLAASGFPAPSLSIGGGLPSGVTFDPASGLLSGVPGPGTGGTYVVRVNAHNAVGSDASQTFVLTVFQPLLSGPANITAQVGIQRGPLTPVGKRGHKPSRTFQETVTITNTGTLPIQGSIVLVLDSLAPRKKVHKKLVPQVTVVNPGGTSHTVSPGSPFVPAGVGQLLPGAQTSFVLHFQTKGPGTISFNPVILVGFGQP